jgi:hypothetical protein
VNTPFFRAVMALADSPWLLKIFARWRPFYPMPSV